MFFSWKKNEFFKYHVVITTIDQLLSNSVFHQYLKDGWIDKTLLRHLFADISRENRLSRDNIDNVIRSHIETYYGTLEIVINPELSINEVTLDDLDLILKEFKHHKLIKYNKEKSGLKLTNKGHVTVNTNIFLATWISETVKNAIEIQDEDLNRDVQVHTIDSFKRDAKIAIIGIITGTLITLSAVFLTNHLNNRSNESESNKPLIEQPAMWV